MSAARIRELNDELRRTGRGGRILLTRGVHERGQAFVAKAVEAVRTFEAFTPENDPHGEHDFGIVEVEGATLYWKIDYYDRDEVYGSPDPADPAVTSRVLTILLREEY